MNGISKNATRTGPRAPIRDAPRVPDRRRASERVKPDRDRFVRETVDWLNRRLAPPGVTVTAETPLFADRLIDSIRILKLIAWTERALGRTIPDEQIRMDNFQSVERIADVFIGGGEPC